MHAQNLIVDQSSNWHTVKNILKLLPQTNGIPIFALVVETVDSVNLAALVVSSEQEEVLLELDLVGEEQDDRLQRVLSAVHVVAQEQVVRLRWEPAVLEQPQQVRELAVRIT